MKTIRLIAAVVLLACAGVAAYYSYTKNFAPPPQVSANGGPPAGISMPRMGGPPAGEGKDGKNSHRGQSESAGQAGKKGAEKGGDDKQK
jgi:hypothetical protein